MRKVPRRYVRQMPKIYGNLQPRTRSYEGLFSVVKALLAVAVIVVGIYGLFYSPLFKIREVQVQGVVLTSADRYRSLVPLGSNIWLISKDHITEEIFKDSLVVSAGIFRGIPHTLRIVIQEKEPAITWQSGDTITLVDSDGFGFTQFTTSTFPAPDSNAGKHLSSVLKVVDTKALPVDISKRLVTSNFVQFVQATRDQFGQLLPGMPIDHLEIADTTYDVTVVCKSGMRVQMNSLADAGVQVRNLTRLITQKKIALNAQVDLRIDRWAYVH